MSAGPSTSQPQPCHSLDGCAPRFVDAVRDALAECKAHGLDVVVYETLRSNELQALYYARGRTVKPPMQTVTNARDAMHGWHFFGLAVDVISATHEWDAPRSWFESVANVFKKHGCDWGGDWHMADLPHMQFGKCKASPSDNARTLYESGGLEAVWRAVGATYEKAA